MDVCKYFLVGLFLSFSLGGFAQLNADFTSDTTRGCFALGVQFSDQSSGNISSWSWDFGNGNTSNLRNPFENFPVGSYTISLTVSDGTNSDTETKTSFINVYREPTVNFTFSPSTGCTPLPVNFRSTSTIGDGPIQDYIWDMDDGSQSPNASTFTHTYNNTGPYQPTLQIIDVNGCSDSKAASSNVNPTASPIASFTTQSPPIGCNVPFTVDFINTSSGSSLSYQWDFGDGSTSTQENPSHTYTALGTYDVQLVVTDPNCNSVLLETDYVILSSTTADFTTPKDSFCFGEEVQFINNSTAATSNSWEFNDNSPRSFAKEPKHVFADSGWFDVTLTTSAGSGCLDQITKQIYIQKAVADFDIQPDFSCQLPDTIQFINQSTNDFEYDWRIHAINAENRDTFWIDFTTKDVTHIVRNEYSFFDTLIIESNLGCKDTLGLNDRSSEVVNTNIRINSNTAQGSSEYGDCYPFTLNFSDSTYGPGNIISYEWSLPEDCTYVGKNPPPFTFDTIGYDSVFLKVTNNLGCTAYDTAIIIAEPVFDAEFTIMPDSVCFGDTVYLLAEDTIASYFQFIVGTANSDPMVKVVELRDTYFEEFSDTGYFTASLTVGEFCKSTLVKDSAFYVKGPVAKPEASKNCSQPREITFTSDAKGYTRFSWDFDDGSPLETTQIDPIHTFPKDTIYNPVLTLYNDTNGCPPITFEIRLNLLPRLKPQALPIEDEYCAGDSVLLRYNNTLFHVTSLWYANGNPLGDFEEKKFGYSQFQDGSNEIILIGTDDLGCSDTIVDYIFISNPIPDFTSDVQGGCIPYDVQFTDLSTADTTIAYWEWILSDDPLDTLRDQNPLRTVNVLGSVDVQLMVEDSFGCKATVIKEDYLSAGNIDAEFATSDELNICVGDEITFFNNSTGGNISSTWDFGDGNVLTDNNNSVTHQFNVAGNYNIKLVIEDQNGCKDSLSRYTVYVDDIPTADFFADQTQATCYPFAVNFFNNSSGNIDTYEWDLGDGDKISVEDPFRNFLAPGNIDISLIVTSPNGCADTTVKQDFIQITGPTADFSIDKRDLCLNEPVTFAITFQNGVSSFRWAFGDGASSTDNPATHIYTDRIGLVRPTLIIEDGLGCEVFVVDSINISDVIAKFSLEDSSGCQPFSPRITNLMEGADNFFWEYGDGRQSTEAVPNFSYDQNGIFDLKLNVSSNIGCSDEAIIPVEVREKPQAAVNGANSICLDDTINLNGSGGIGYQWYLNDFNNSISSQNSIRIWPAQTTNYLLEVENSVECLDTVNWEVYVQQPPSYTPINDTVLIIGEQIQVDASAGIGFSYNWTPTNGLSCSDCPNPIMKPLRTTTYYLDITDENNCYPLSDTVKIEVIEEYTLDVPQAFSPNGDGINDEIYARGWGLKNLIAFKIYNRFGELVFEGNSFDQGWDGTFRGKDQMIETYVYTVEAETYGGEVLRKKGNIALIR